MADWKMEGQYLKTCNCDPGCPCDYNQAPTHGDCHGIAAMLIEDGHFGDVSLNGIKWVGQVKFPGRMDEGNGDFQMILDENASDEQRQALETIFSGQAGGTFFQIVDVVCPNKKPTLTAAIEWTWDLEARSAHVKAGDIFETTVETLRGIDPPDPYRVITKIPGGFEYANETGEAETALAKVLRSGTDIPMDVTDGNANLCYVKHEGEVPVAA